MQARNARRAEEQRPKLRQHHARLSKRVRRVLIQYPSMVLILYTIVGVQYQSMETRWLNSLTLWTPKYSRERSTLRTQNSEVLMQNCFANSPTRNQSPRYRSYCTLDCKHGRRPARSPPHTSAGVGPSRGSLFSADDLVCCTVTFPHQTTPMGHTAAAQARGGTTTNRCSALRERPTRDRSLLCT